MKPIPLDFTIYQGSTFLKTFQWKTGDSPTPVDLTGYIARMHIRKKVKSDDIIISLTTENGRIEFINAQEGRFSLKISATDTANLDFRTAVYDLEFESPTGFVRRLFEGNVILSPEVTR